MNDRYITRVISLTMLLISTVCTVSADAPGALVYQSPRPDANMVSPGTTIVVRYDKPITDKTIQLTVTGKQNRLYHGETAVESDGRTLIFTPDTPFSAGERVTVALAKTTWQFTVSKIIEPITPPISIWLERHDIDMTKATDQRQHIVSNSEPKTLNFNTLPESYPHIRVLKSSDKIDDGYLFLSPYDMNWQTQSFANPYLMIIDNHGLPVFHRKLPRDSVVFDFKPQPNNTLTYAYFNKFEVLDSHYNHIDTILPGNGYISPDIHELRVLPNGNTILIVYDWQKVDMSALVASGQPHARVAGLIIQELNPQKKVVFEWRSWDHFEITDSYVDLTQPYVDYVHGNAIDIAADGNLLLSSRGLNEITKINRETGDVMWRLGGKQNDFTFINDPDGFSEQHDITQLDDGHILLYDNHSGNGRSWSRAVEYALDEEAMTAEQVWEYRRDIWSPGMGSARRLANGNTLIGAGSHFPTTSTLLEITPDNDVALEMRFEQPNDYNRVTYRAIRAPWQGYPSAKPDLFVEESDDTISISYSWNGATQIDHWNLYLGVSLDSLRRVVAIPHNQYEQTLHLPHMSGLNFFRVAPTDRNGVEISQSKIIALRRVVPLTVDVSMAKTANIHITTMSIITLSTLLLGVTTHQIRLSRN